MKAKEAANDKLRQELEAKLKAPVDITEAAVEFHTVADARRAYEEAVEKRKKAEAAARRANDPMAVPVSTEARRRKMDQALERAIREETVALLDLQKEIKEDLKRRIKELR